MAYLFSKKVPMNSEEAINSTVELDQIIGASGQKETLLMPNIHGESHRTDRTGWLRAAVLGANDGTISVASLVVGVAAAGASQGSILLTGVAGLVAGAMSMAAGEYVSVQSQADTEKADIETEKSELENEPERELAELTSIYVRRGLDLPLARLVAENLMSGDALEAHARDEPALRRVRGHGQFRPHLLLQFLLLWGPLFRLQQRCWRLQPGLPKSHPRQHSLL